MENDTKKTNTHWLTNTYSHSDGCRRKKIKCDTAGPGHPCKNCQAAKVECTFNDR